MNTPSVLPGAWRLRVATLLGLMSLALGPALRADPLNCDLSGYKASRGLTASAKGDVLTVTWTVADATELRARYAIDHGQPMIRELAVRAAHGSWSVLGQNLTPEFDVQTGHRRIDFAGLSPLRGLGVDITSQAVMEKQAWVSFWDAPFVIPSDPKRTPGPLRSATEVQRASGQFATASCA